MPPTRGNGPPDDIDYVALERYFAGDAAVVAQIEAWIAADPARTVEVERLRAIWQASAQPDVEAALRRVTGREPATLRPVALVEGGGRRRTLRAWSDTADTASGRSAMRRVVAIAAALVVAVGATVATDRLLLEPGASQQFRQFGSARGSRTTITLRDGSRLVLGPDTRLRVPGDFGVRTRTVDLDGEALFTVVHDAGHPFVVRTSRTSIQDVGTTFSVRAYPGDREERVAVAEGEVAVAGVTLRALDAASVDSSRRITVRHIADVAPYMGWVQGALVFKDTPLREVVRELARTYDLNLTIVDSTLSGLPVTASFGEEPVDEVLNAITRVVGAHYERTGRTVVIRRGALPMRRSTPPVSAELRMTRGSDTR